MDGHEENRRESEAYLFTFYEPLVLFLIFLIYRFGWNVNTVHSLQPQMSTCQDGPIAEL